MGKEEQKQPKIAITMGDPAGIGPEIILKALAMEEIYQLCSPCVIGSAGMLQRIARLLGRSVQLHPIQSVTEARFTPGTIDVLTCGTLDADTLPLGTATAAGGKASVDYLTRAIQLALQGEVDAIVTAPLNKAALHAAGLMHSGHTEILAQQTQTRHYTMMLISRYLRIFHVSTHVSLREACQRVKKERILQVIALAHRELQRLGIPEPRIAVAGLNPHAGEGGLFGTEEEEEIRPAVAEARARGWRVEGPISPDAVFVQAMQKRYDGVIAMYHDQGHIPFKVTDFSQGVNVTVGLPIIRTSVDHGTAYDIVGKGVADHQNLVAAIRVAVDLVRGRWAEQAQSRPGS